MPQSILPIKHDHLEIIQLLKSHIHIARNTGGNKLSEVWRTFSQGNLAARWNQLHSLFGVHLCFQDREIVYY